MSIRPVTSSRTLLLLLVFLSVSTAVSAQIVRERAVTGGPVEDLFWAPTVISTASVANLPKGNANMTIMHSFGLVSGGISQLYGLDGTANIRFGLDYGLTDRISIGMGRSKAEKVYDFRTKVSLLRQTTDGRTPVEVALKGDLGITTEQNGYAFTDRLSWFGSLIVARKMSDRLSIQVSPMFSHFNSVEELQTDEGPVVPEFNTAAVGLAARYVLNERLALVAEFVPVIGSRTTDTRNAMALGIEIDTGGHVFQLFAASSHWLTEQYTLARSTDDFLAGDFRLGFNVNRVFSLGK